MFLRERISKLLLSVPPKTWSVFYNQAPSFIRSGFDVRLPGEKVHKLAMSMLFDDELDLYKSLIGRTLGLGVPFDVEYEKFGLEHPPKMMSVAQMFMFWDQVFYLPGDILTKVDRASMSVSLETRAPFLNHKIAEFAWLMTRKEGFIDGGQKSCPSEAFTKAT